MNVEKLHPASYRKVPFKVSRTSTSGGRKDAKQEFINSNRQLIEDLGLRQRVFTVSGVVTAELSNGGSEIRSHEEVRKALLDALEKGGTGVLVHPFFGEIQNVACRTWILSESTSSLGSSAIEITFEISNTTGTPQVDKNVLGLVEFGNENVKAAASADIAARVEATPRATGNFSDAVDKANDFVTDINAAADPAAFEADRLDAFANTVSEFSRDVTSLVSGPQDLADSMIGVFDALNGVHTSIDGTFDAFERLFDYGDLDVPFSLVTVGQIERQKNRDVMNGNVQAMALSHAYLSGVQKEFPTVADVDAIALVLENQFQKIKTTAVLDSSVDEALAKQRIAADDFFQDQRATAPRVIEVRTNLTSTRLLSYRYYGTTSRGDEIAELNGLVDSACVEGLVKVLTA